MLVFDAEAIGILRAELINTVGLERAEGILTRFGFACGYNDAIAAEKSLKPDFNYETAGALFHEMQGHVKVNFTLSEINKEERS